MKKLEKNMLWIGTIQDLGKPYADLYIDKDQSELILLVRISKCNEQNPAFAAISVTPAQVMKYMGGKTLMSDVFSSLPSRHAFIKDKTIDLQGDEFISSPSTFQYNQPFDPELSRNKTKITLVMRKMMQNC